VRDQIVRNLYNLIGRILVISVKSGDNVASGVTEAACERGAISLFLLFNNARAERATDLCGAVSRIIIDDEYFEYAGRHCANNLRDRLLLVMAGDDYRDGFHRFLQYRNPYKAKGMMRNSTGRRYRALIVSPKTSVVSATYATERSATVAYGVRPSRRIRRYTPTKKNAVMIYQSIRITRINTAGFVR
jgi:hypothetical protein